MRKLNRGRKYSEVYGDSYARFYQDGVYFDASGDEISSEAAAMDSTSGQIMAGSERELIQEPDQELPSIAAAVAAAEANAAALPLSEPKGDEPPPEVADVEGDIDSAEDPDALRVVLNKLHHKVITQMVTNAGIEPATGDGAKNANVDKLIELRFQEEPAG